MGLLEKIKELEREMAEEISKEKARQKAVFDAQENEKYQKDKKYQMLVRMWKNGSPHCTAGGNVNWCGHCGKIN